MCRHLASAAFRHISRRCSAVNLAAVALPPFSPPNRPSSTAAGFLSLGGSSGASSVASCTMALARRLRSRGFLLDRFGIGPLQHMPECRLCGRRRVAGKYALIVKEGEQRHQVTEYVCNPCWRLLDGGGTKGHLFRPTGKRWWLPRYAPQFSN